MPDTDRHGRKQAVSDIEVAKNPRSEARGHASCVHEYDDASCAQHINVSPSLQNTAISGSFIARSAPYVRRFGWIEEGGLETQPKRSTYGALQISANPGYLRKITAPSHTLCRFVGNDVR